MINLRTLWTLALAVTMLAGGAPTPVALAQEPGRPAALVVNYVEATAARGADGSNQLFAYVKLVDSEGQPVADARVQSAEVTLDEGAPVAATFGPEAQNIFTILVLDSSGSMVGERAEAARTAVIAFVNAKGADDQVGVIFFNDTVVYTGDFTADRVTAIRSVSFVPPERTPGSCVWDALYAAVERMRRLPLGRRAIVLVTDGPDQTLPGGPACSQKTLDEVIAHATEPRVHVPIYALGIGNDQSLDAEALQRLADETGGMAAIGEASGEVEALFETLAVGLRAEFMVSAEVASLSGMHGAQIKVTLDDGQSFVAFASVEVPAAVYGPPTPAPVELPTVASVGLDTPTGATVGAPPTVSPITANPPYVEIVEVSQDAADGGLLLRLDVRAREVSVVTAVIVLLDGTPLETLPPGAFDGEIKLPLDAAAAGTHVLSVEAYDTGGQVGHDQMTISLRAPAEVVAVAEEPTVSATPTATPTEELFTLSAPVTAAPDAGLEAEVTALPTLETVPATGTPPPTFAPVVSETPAPAPPARSEGTSTSPALVVIGLIIIVGGLALGGLWWWRRLRLRPSPAPGGAMEPMARPTGTVPLKPSHGFSYEAYGEETAVAGGGAERTDFYGPDDAERTSLYLGDIARAKLDVVRSPDMDAKVNAPYTLETTRTTLGRDASNDIAFTGDRFVSSNHARIIYAEDQWFLQELGALNKTFLNGREVIGRAPLFDGDLIELGPYTRLRFVVEEPDAPSAPPPPPPLGGDDGDEELTQIHLD